MSTTPRSPESASVATPVQPFSPARQLPAEVPVRRTAAPVKRATLPAKKVAIDASPVVKAVVKKAAAKKLTAKKSPPQKAAVKKPLSKTFSPVKAKKTAPPLKIKKDKLVRDSFTMPKPEYAVLAELKQRAVRLARSVKKSELLRAGIKMLATLSDAALLTALAQVPTIKTGRPPLKK
jgi:hypothetical protein